MERSLRLLLATSASLALLLLLGCQPPTPMPLTLNRIELYLAGLSPTGTLTAEIRDAGGITVLTAAAVTIPGTGVGWFSIDLPDITIYTKTTYTIYVTRANPHKTGLDEIIWYASPNGYPGEPIPSLANGYRFCFRTYYGSTVEQESPPTVSYGYAIYNTSWYGQEFTPGD